MIDGTEKGIDITKPAHEGSVKVARQRMDADIVCIGFGPATPGLTPTLGHLKMTLI